jgi:hypothetical protein
MTSRHATNRPVRILKGPAHLDCRVFSQSPEASRQSNRRGQRGVVDSQAAGRPEESPAIERMTLRL